MFRRVLLNLENNIYKELKHKKSIFKTKWKIQDKSCNMIINVGSIENLVSIEVIENWSWNLLHILIMIRWHGYK